MARQTALPVGDSEHVPRDEPRKQLLRFMICGGVDDGKSTLIARLVFECNGLDDEERTVLEADSGRMEAPAGGLDFARLLDGVSAEREAGMTIDVAYRFFATARRRYIVADTPGHEQYTRNMVSGASTAAAAVLIVDARKGVLAQTRRHSYIASLLGIRHILVAVNKMDLVDYAEAPFRAVADELHSFAARIGLDELAFVPVSARNGDNVVAASANMPWYHGSTLMGWLEAVEIGAAHPAAAAFRFPVQGVDRRHDFRGFAGTIAGGAIRSGERVRVQPSGRESTVARIVAADGDLECAVAGQAVTLTLADATDVARGDMISAASDPAEVADQFETTLIWMADEPMLPGRPYLFKIGARAVNAQIGELKYKVNINSLEHVAAKTLALNEIGVCNLSLDHAVAFDAYKDNRDTGAFVLIDRVSNATVGAGLIDFALRRAHNIHLQALDLNKTARAQLKGQKSCVLWLTGLSGAGKSTIANLVEKRLHARGRHTYLLDGDNVRHGLNKDLGFTDADRVENIRRVAEVAKLMVDAGLIVITAFISPFRAERRLARELVETSEFIEIFVDAPLSVAEERDRKGLYRKARRGELKNFTGIDSPYELPEHADMHIETTRLAPDAAADLIVDELTRRGLIAPLH